MLRYEIFDIVTAGSSVPISKLLRDTIVKWLDDTRKPQLIAEWSHNTNTSAQLCNW